MKKIIFAILLFVSAIYFSQSQSSDSENFVLEKVDKAAEFEGGIPKFRQLAVEKFNSKKVKCAKGITKSSAKFVVERDGTIGTVEMTGDNQSLNNEVERVIKSIEIKWKPALVNGVPVRSYYRFPFNLSCD